MRNHIFDAFNRTFEDKLSNNKKRTESFDEADREFKEKFGFSVYKDYDSFKGSRYYHRKRRK